jgi:hypothetical protein
MLQGFTTNKAFVAMLAAFGSATLAADAPLWAKAAVAGAAWLATYFVKNADTSTGEHEAG